jgi:hypothetical protein
MWFTIVLLSCVMNVFGSMQLGFVQNSSVRTNTTLLASTDPECFDCLCNCLSDETQKISGAGKCYGINCFPSIQACQRIEQQWVQEADLVFNNTSDQFIIARDMHFCSCYSPQKMLDQLKNTVPIAIAHANARFLMYNPYDDTLIVLGDNLIGQYSASNVSLLRSISVTTLPVAVCLDSRYLYISFVGNMSVNKYSMSLRFIGSRQLPLRSSATYYYGMTAWKNGLLVTDNPLSLIWFIESNTMNASIYLNLTTYNVEPFNIAVFDNRLYISQLSSSNIYVFDMTSGSMQTIIFPNSITLYRLTMDPFCHRLWFGTPATRYSSVPVLDLDTDMAQVYQAAGSLARSKTCKVEFDADYSMYTVSINENYFYKYSLPPMTCDQN